MGKCCKKSKAAPKAAASGSAAVKTGSSDPAGVPMNSRLTEAALAAGILILAPVILQRIAPNALKCIREGFELASRPSKV